VFLENQFCSLSVWDFYALILGYFALKFLPDIRHCLYWVLVEIWASDLSHKIHNKFFIHHSQGWNEGLFVCETFWFFFVGEYSSVLPEICRILSQIQLRFLRDISGKKYFGRIFQKFCANQGYPLPKLVKFRLTFSNFFLGPYYAEKIHTSTFICCLHPCKVTRP